MVKLLAILNEIEILTYPKKLEVGKVYDIFFDDKSGPWITDCEFTGWNNGKQGDTPVGFFNKDDMYFYIPKPEIIKGLKNKHFRTR